MPGSKAYDFFVETSFVEVRLVSLVSVVLLTQWY